MLNTNEVLLVDSFLHEVQECFVHLVEPMSMLNIGVSKVTFRSSYLACQRGNNHYMFTGESLWSNASGSHFEAFWISHEQLTIWC